MQEFFYDVVSGRKKNLSATLIRCGLQMLEMPYSAAVEGRNRLYDLNILAVDQFQIPMISVGNLTLGGTGKSPMTAWLVNLFLQKNVKPGLISRGYKKEKNKTNDEHTNDEHKEMRWRFPDVPHLQNTSRAQAVRQLLKHEHHEHIDVIILDDAFQHRQIRRDIDIVLLDATAPFGFEHIFPRGTLRESVSQLRRADIVVLTRSDLIDEQSRQAIKRRVLSINPTAVWSEAVHRPTSLVSQIVSQKSAVSQKLLSGESIETIRGLSALAFCGIGNPPAFRHTLETCGVRVEKLIVYPDHYSYTDGDVAELRQTAQTFGTDLILCTMKDLVKLTAPDARQQPIQAVAAEIQFSVGEETVCETLFSKLNLN